MLIDLLKPKKMCVYLLEQAQQCAIRFGQFSRFRQGTEFALQNLRKVGSHS